MQSEIATLLSHAAGQDSTGSAAGYLRKFADEFRINRDQPYRLSTSVLASYDTQNNQILAGVGYDTVWIPGEELADESAAEALVRASLASRHVGGAVATRNDVLLEAQGVLAFGMIGVWAGRRSLGYSIGQGGGIVTQDALLDGAGVFLTRPIGLPFLGNLRFEMHVSKIDNVLNLNDEQKEVEPYYWTARGSLEPHARLRIGVTRGMMFGGEGNVPVTTSRLIKNLIGIYTGEGENSFANQSLSVDFRYRVPSGSLPIAVYLEWGAEDAAGGWWTVPAILGGFEVAMPGAPDFAVGVERVEFMPTAESNSIWYQNAWFRGGWTDEGRALGHPLGGHGTEWRAFAGGGSGPNGISGDIAAFTRRRRSENIFAPTREGSSIGGEVSVDARLTNRWHLVLEAEIERGENPQSWTASRTRTGIRFSF